MDKIERYMKKIKEHYADIDIRNYEINNIGQKNDIIIINNEYVFRFQKYQKGIETLKIETEVIKSIKDYITLTIPNPIYDFFKYQEIGEVFAGYKMIPGKSLYKDTFMSIRDKGIIAKQLATFLRELHNISPGKVKNVNVPVYDSHKKWTNFFRKINKKLFKYMSPHARKNIEKEFEKFLNEEDNFNFQSRLIHGDFGPTNILFDEKLQEISGIIDFGDVRFDDPAIDVAALIGPFGYGESFVNMFNEIYPGINLLIKRGKFYASTFALQEALFGIERGDREAFNNGIAQL